MSNILKQGSRISVSSLTDLNSFPYFEFVAVSLLLIWGWETFLNLRQRRKLQNKLPPQVLLDYKLTTKEKFEQSQAYGLDKNSFGMFKDVWEVLTTLLWLSAGYHYLWNISFDILTYFGYDAVSYVMYHSILFMILFNLIGTIEGIPFELYHTFVIEEKHGFNKQTISLFITDTIKKILISVVMICIILPIILYIIEWGGTNFVYYVWGAVSVILLIMMWLIPSVIMPCFYKFDVLEEDTLPEGQKTLVSDLKKLAQTLSFPLKKLFVMDGSKRSSHSNAFQYGFCGNKRIVLFDTLLTQATTTEIVAILAHELGHWYYSHTVRALITSEVQIFLMFFGFSIVYTNNSFYNAFGFGVNSNNGSVSDSGMNKNENAVLIGLLLFMHIWSPIQSVLHFLINAMTRYHEYQADAFACELKYGDSLYSGLVKIHSENKANLDPDWLFSAYHHSHPPLIQRLQAIEKIEEKEK